MTGTTGGRAGGVANGRPGAPAAALATTAGRSRARMADRNGPPRGRHGLFATTGPAGPRRDQRGFTLIELIVVLFILSLATGLTLPAAGRGLENVELRAQAAGVGAFLRYGREQAITRRRAHEVRVDPEAHRLTLLPAGSESPRARKQLSPRVRIRLDSPDARSVTFSPQGFSSGASLRLEGRGGRVYRVTVDPITGRVASSRVTG